MAEKKEPDKLKELEIAKDRDLLHYFEASAEVNKCNTALVFAQSRQSQAQATSARSVIEYLRVKLGALPNG